MIRALGRFVKFWEKDKHMIKGTVRKMMVIVFSVVVLLLSASIAMAANRLILVAPGESFLHGTGWVDAVPNSQVAGVAFDVEIGSIDDSSWNYITTYALVTMTATSSATFNPASGAQNLEQDTPVSNCRYTPFVTTLLPAATSDVTISTGTNNPSGIQTGQKIIHIYYMDKFFYDLPVSWDVGEVNYVTVTARDNNNDPVLPFDGTVSFRALNGGINGSDSGVLDTVSFTNGVAYPRIQLFYAGSGIQLEASTISPDPGTIVTSTSGSITVNTGPAGQFLIVGPGQSIQQGETGGDGVDGSMDIQTAGVPFRVTIYACDQYWNLITPSTTIALGATDLGFGGSIMQVNGTLGFLTSGVAYFDVDLRRVLAGSQTLTVAGGLTTDEETVPLDNATHASFGFNTIASPQYAGTGFSLVVTAYDVYGNTCTSTGSVAGTVNLVANSSSDFDASAYAPGSISGSQFDGDGNWTGTYTIYRTGFTIGIRADNGATDDDSGTFNVEASQTTSLYRYIVIMPGQTYHPGENQGDGFGRSAAPTDMTVGDMVSVIVYATDLYGNQLTSGVYSTGDINNSLERIDAGATVPSTAALSNGRTVFSIVLTTAYSGSNQQQLQCTGAAPIPGQSNYFNVLATSLDHFTVGNIGGTQTAGSAFNVNISARDEYENIVTSFTGPVYVTCPDLDYHNPEQSVLSVPTYGTATGVTWTVSSGFSSGVWSHNMLVYRAGTDVEISVSQNVNGTGVIGTSASFDVNANTHQKVFMIVPGLEYRPGVGGGDGNSLGGYYGTPNAQEIGTPFYVTVYATDDWWNPVFSSGSFTMTTVPDTSNIHNTDWEFNLGNTVVAVVLNGSETYRLTADYDTTGIDDYTTPYYFDTTSLNRFMLTGFGGAVLPDSLTAGVPFDLSITAYADAGSTIASTFNGQTNLVTSADYAEPYRVISPQQIIFTNGIWYGQATVFRAYTNVNIQCQLGSVPSVVSVNPTVYHNAANRMLALATGMTPKPGIAPNVYPPGGFPGYEGNPEIHEAGVSYDLKIYVCDEYYNVVTHTASGGTDQIQISSSDPYPATMGTMLGAGQNLPQTVNVGAFGVNSPQDPGYPYGGYRTTDFVLYTVGINGYQTLTVANLDNGSVTSFTLGGGGNPPINVRHNDQIRQFQVDMDTSAKTAGVAFSVTVTAQDGYGNTMDNRNTASAFPASNNVNLSSGSGTNTLYPTVIQLPSGTYGGVGYPSLTLYKEYIGNSITATFSDTEGTHGGTSSASNVNANSFARLIPVVPSMDINGGGVYSTPSPGAGFVGYSGSPGTQNAGTPIASFRVYACDTYGNVTEGAVDWVYVKTTDRFASIPTPVQINWTSGYAEFNGSQAFAFHQAADADISNTPFIITAYDVIETTQSLTRANGSTLDALGTTNVIDIIKVHDGSAVYVENWDYQQNGDSIEWLGRDAPAGGASFTAHWVYSNPAGISTGTTPGIYVNPASVYGLVTVAPGQILVEGSGNSLMASGIGGVTSGGWYSGVTLTEPSGDVENSLLADPEISGAAFGVTVYPVDRFGNQVESIVDNFEVRTNSESDPQGIPNVSSPIVSVLVLDAFNYASAWVEATLYTLGQLTIYPWDTTNGTLNHNQESRSDVQIVSYGQTYFKVWVNGVEQPGPITVDAAPNTFSVRVEVRDDTSHQIVATANTTFVMDAVTNMATNDPGSGTLNLTVGQTINGVLETSNQHYDVGETIYLRVREASGGDRPTYAYSAEISVNTPVATPTSTATPTPTLNSTVTVTPEVITSTPTCTITATPTSTPFIQEGQVMAYPNPARGKMYFAYTVVGEVKATIQIFNLLGERVARIEESSDGGGGRTVSTVWAAQDVAPGIYFCIIKVTDMHGKIILEQKKKVALVR